MNTILAKSTLATAIALTIVACGPDGGSLAGIGGSGYISSGSVSGFGSVFVNGVEFETDSATFDVDGVPGTQADLAIGMVVRVNGTINDNGVTGTASSISFDDELQGPVAAPIIYDVDGVTGTFTILGIKVVIDSSSTSFDIDGDLPATTVFGFDTIAVDNNVEVSGFFDTNGTLQATRVELKELIFVPSSSIIEVEGVISSLNGTTFNLDLNPESLIIDASTAALDDLPNGLEDSQRVEVKGTYDIASNTVTASRVEAEDDSAEDTDEFELEGIITDYDAINNTFKIGEITVDASNLSLDPAFTLSNDLRVEVEGAIVNGILIASEIELEGSDIKVHAMVSSVDLATNSFKIEPLPGQEITVTVTTGTQLEADGFEDAQYTLTDLLNNPGFVEVSGLDDGDSGITAIEVDIKGSDVGEVIVQGYATVATGNPSLGTMTVLGVTFNFDFSTTDFEIDSDVEGAVDIDMSKSQVNDLITAINTAPQLVKIVDKKFPEGNPVGDADEIEIESP